MISSPAAATTAAAEPTVAAAPTVAAVPTPGATRARPDGGAVARPPELTVARTVTEAKATTFALACRLLPAAIRDDVYRLYLVFRTLDDLVDEGDDADLARDRIAAVASWADGDLSAPLTDEVGALAALSQRYPISRRAVGDFCLGMQQDLTGAGFATEREVDRYCYRVAGTVGVVMTGLLGGEDEDAQACAAALGMAMQRTNILRDIDEDLAAGRIYISAEARAAYGRSLEPGRRAALVRAQITRADDLYRDGLAGVRTLRDGRLAVRLAASLYQEILREIERREDAGRAGRAVVSGPRKLAVATRLALVAS